MRNELGLYVHAEHFDRDGSNRLRLWAEHNGKKATVEVGEVLEHFYQCNFWCDYDIQGYAPAMEFIKSPFLVSKHLSRFFVHWAQMNRATHFCETTAGEKTPQLAWLGADRMVGKWRAQLNRQKGLFQILIRKELEKAFPMDFGAQVIGKLWFKVNRQAFASRAPNLLTGGLEGAAMFAKQPWFEREWKGSKLFRQAILVLGVMAEARRSLRSDLSRWRDWSRPELMPKPVWDRLASGGWPRCVKFTAFPRSWAMPRIPGNNTVFKFSYMVALCVGPPVARANRMTDLQCVQNCDFPTLKRAFALYKNTTRTRAGIQSPRALDEFSGWLRDYVVAAERLPGLGGPALRGSLYALTEDCRRWHEHRRRNMARPVGMARRGELWTEYQKTDLCSPLPEGLELPAVPDVVVTFLGTYGDLLLEAERMDHCVDDYFDYAQAGASYLFHIETVGGGQLTATAEIKRTGKLAQIRGHRNQENELCRTMRPVMTEFGKQLSLVLLFDGKASEKNALEEVAV